MKKYIILLGLCANVALADSVPVSAPLTIDGAFKDWGIQNNGKVSGWTARDGVFYVVEDQSNASNGYLSPGWGGQAYDAEALYVSWQTKSDGQTYLNLGLITGHDPSTATSGNSYGRGDFAIDMGSDGSWDYGVLTAQRSATLQQGDVVKTTNADWSAGLWSSPGVLDPQHSPYVTKVSSGSEVGQGKVQISNPFVNMGVLGGTHWFYEAEIPVSVFGDRWKDGNPVSPFDVQWTELCANDIVTVHVDSGGAKVGEPKSLWLVLGGLGAVAALGGAGQRSRRQA
jgi:hypothetical protein